MGEVINLRDGRLLTPTCEPLIDSDTIEWLLVLLSEMVAFRDSEAHPARRAAMQEMTELLCEIIARHEPKEGA